MRPEQGKASSSSPGGSVGTTSQETGRSHRHGRETVEFSVKGPIGVSVNEEHLSNSGCAVLDLIFTAPSQVGELTFRNYYTMWLSILVKAKSKPTYPEAGSGVNIGSLPLNQSHAKEDVSDWIMSIPKKLMMQYPHHETGSQDTISIPCTESIVEWKNLVAMRIILKQPSPVWKTFHIEEINVYKDLPRRSANKESAAESLMILIKKQTIVSLKCSSSPESLSQGYSGAYEFNNLPQP